MISPFPGPVPAYYNVPIESDWFMPRGFIISGLTLGQQTTVTTTSNMDYVVGQQVRLLIPYSYGSRQLNEKQGMIIEIVSANQVVVNIDSSIGVDPFVSGSNKTKPQIIAIGDFNNGQINTGRTNNATYVPGSFQNIS